MSHPADATVPSPLLVAVCFVSVVCVRLAAAEPASGSGGSGAASREPGIEIRVRETVAPTQESQGSVAVAPSRELTAEEIRRVAERVPEPKLESTTTPLQLPPGPKPPARAGEEVLAPFPPPDSADDLAPKTSTEDVLQIIRHAPEGEVPLVPRLSLTFSQPMVALATAQDQAKAPIPVTIEPAVEGSWRWAGTRALVFEPTEPLPRATEFTVTVDTTTRSAQGKTLATPYRFSFATPPPSVARVHGLDGQQAPDAPIWIEFDQRIKPRAVLSALAVMGAGKDWPLRLATESEVTARFGERVKRAKDGNWLAVVPVAELSEDTEFKLVVGGGVPSAEGPRRSQQPEIFEFHSVGPLRLERAHCPGREDCRPGSPWFLHFNATLDPATVTDETVTVTPSLPDARIRAGGNRIYISGQSRGRTTYRIGLNSSIASRHGRLLGSEQEVAIRVGPPHRRLFAAQRDGFIVLEPSGNLHFPFYSINYPQLSAKLYTVDVDDWEAYASFSTARQRGRNREVIPTPPNFGQLASESILPVDDLNGVVEHRIDVTDGLKNGRGHVVVWVDTGGPEAERETLALWIQVTNIALDTFIDSEQLLVFANALDDGRPLGGVRVRGHDGVGEGVTGADGTLILPLGNTTRSLARSVLHARLGGDDSFLPESTKWWSRRETSQWRRKSPPPDYRWYVVNDSGVYRPGETVKIKGWLRRMEMQKGGQLGGPGRRVRTVRYSLRGPGRESLGSGELVLGPLGGFDLSLDLPEDLRLGTARLALDVTKEDGKTEQFSHGFSVLHFRRPDFEVAVEADGNIHMLGDEARVEVAASYYSGSHLADAEVEWSVTASSSSYSPPGHSEFTFGEWRPWWRSWSFESDRDIKTLEVSGTTDLNGRHGIAVEFVSIEPPAPLSIEAEATVEGPDNQAIAGRTALLAHPSAHYVGLRASRAFVEPNEPFTIESIVTDIPGALLPERSVTLVVERLQWVRQPEGRWTQTAEELSRHEVTSLTAPTTTPLTLAVGGNYRVTARVQDEAARTNQTRISLWVAGGNSLRPDRLEESRVSFVPQKKEYSPGETASVLVQAPFFPAEAILTVRRLGVLYHERFRMEGPTYTVTIPIVEQHIPNIHLQVDLVGRRTARDGDAATVPAFASGELSLSVPPHARTLNLQATPRENELAPGSETVVDLQVRRADGQAAAGAEVAVIVVDEAVLALLGHSLADPIETFYQALPAAVEGRRFRRHVLHLNDADKTDESASEPRVMRAMGRGAALSEEAAVGFTAEEDGADAPIAVRERFDSRILFAPHVRTDADGRAHVALKLSDSLSRYRVMAVAAHGERHFGQAEASITARLPMMVRATPPRFLYQGDRFELPVVIDNQSANDTEVDVLVRAHGARVLTTGRRVTVAGKTQATLHFSLETLAAATLRVQAAAIAKNALSETWSDAAEYSVPVWLPATLEATATYGTVSAKSTILRQPVVTPEDVIDSYGGLELTTSSTALHELTDAILYLVDYPFDCSEQIASRVLGIAALRDALGAFSAAGLPDAATLEKAMTRDLEALIHLQNPDGGFGFWRRSRNSWPYLSVHVAHALVVAAEKGFEVPGSTLSNSQQYLEQIDRRIPEEYGAQARITAEAYACRVLARMKVDDPQRPATLVRGADLSRLPIEAAGWLLAALGGLAEYADERRTLHDFLSSRATEEASTAQFTSGYDADAHLVLHSARRADAVVLEALLEGGTPAGLTALIPKLARGLLAHRKKGRWNNTQENALVLLALGRFFEVYEHETPDFTTRAWLADTFVGSQHFAGRVADHRSVQIPTSYLRSLPSTDFTLEKTGPGRLYYRLGLRYAPQNPMLPAVSRGMFVERTYEAVDDKDDVQRDEDGTWRIQSGARVRVRTTFVAPERRYHVALVDALPAGLEPLQPELLTTGRLPGDDENGPRPLWCCALRWYEHADLRDRGAQVFSSLVYPGVAEYSYFARATTTGRFVAPPTRVEEMYQPETFGHSASALVTVER